MTRHAARTNRRMSKMTSLGAIAIASPVQFREIVLSAFDEAHYVATDAAKILASRSYTVTVQPGELEYRQLARLIARAKLGSEIDARREARGLRTPPRPPRTISRAGSGESARAPLELERADESTPDGTRNGGDGTDAYHG